MAPDDFTLLLQRWSAGDEAALKQLTPVVYQELHLMARAHFARERSGSTLQPTALLNEAYLKLASHKQNHWHGRAQFFAMASRVMRQVLIEHARSRRSQKRGAGEKPVSLDEALTSGTARSEVVLALDEALQELAKLDERKARLIELKYFGGLSGEELGEAVGISKSTLYTELRFAEAWLHKYLAGK
jgi:RNA polymerase sigma factor (TIGR02999 family)